MDLDSMDPVANKVASDEIYIIEPLFLCYV